MQGYKGGSGVLRRYNTEAVAVTVGMLRLRRDCASLVAASLSMTGFSLQLSH